MLKTATGGLNEFLSSLKNQHNLNKNINSENLQKNIFSY